LTPVCEQALDRYEGFPQLYGKESVVVINAKDNAGYRVMAYVMTPGHAEMPNEPSLGYFNGILQGYRQNGLPVQPLYNALRATRDEIAIYQGTWNREQGIVWPAHKPGKRPKNRGR
jgi:hypothetical protein